MGASSKILVRQLSTTAAKNDLQKPPIQLFGLQGRYATALYSAAVKEKSLDAVEKEVKMAQALFKSDAKFDEFIRNPTVARSLKKDDLLLRIFSWLWLRMVGYTRWMDLLMHLVLLWPQSGEKLHAKLLLPSHLMQQLRKKLKLY